MAPRQKRLLLAVDGSERALQTVRYAGEEDAFKGMKIVLFHVFNSIPDAYYDLEKEPKSVRVVRHVRSWEAQQKKNIRKYMDDARQMLLSAGHAEPAVDINIQARRKGVARDIIIEAHKGYDAVLVRRRGATALKNIIVGSVTNKLLEKLSFIPVLIAGRKQVNKKVLVAVDGSPCANRAVQFVADTLGPAGNYQVRLVHVVRGGTPSDIDVYKENGIADSGADFFRCRRCADRRWIRCATYLDQNRFRCIEPRRCHRQSRRARRLEHHCCRQTGIVQCRRFFHGPGQQQGGPRRTNGYGVDCDLTVRGAGRTRCHLMSIQPSMDQSTIFKNVSGIDDHHGY
jgi:nucleotide-binding universal stress UspA family protein